MRARPITDLQTEIRQGPAVMAILNHLRLAADKFGIQNFELVLTNRDTGLMHLGLEHVDFKLEAALSNMIYRRFAGSASADETAGIINEMADIFDEHPAFNQFIEEFEVVCPLKGLDLRNYLLAQSVGCIFQVCVTQRREAWFVEWQQLQAELNKIHEGEAPYAALLQNKRDQIHTELLKQQQNVKAKIETSVDLQRSVSKMLIAYEHANLSYRFRTPAVNPARKLKTLAGTKQIDVLKLNRDSRELLAALLEAYPKAKFFDAKDPLTKKSIVYLVPDPWAKHPGQMRRIKLKDSLVRYMRKKDNHEHRFAVCHATPIGSGGYGIVYESTATLKMHHNKNGHIVGLHCKRKHPDKARAVKHFLHAAPAPRERDIMQKVVLLHVKEVVMSQKLNRAALVMRRIKGSTLIDLLIADDKQLKSGKGKTRSMFSLDQLLALTIMIGEAIINQVHANKLIHRDIKPDNLMVELDQHNNPLSVVVIDYGLAKAKDEVTEEGVGTRIPIDYRAPEVTRDINPESDEKSDVYAYSVMLYHLIWKDVIKAGIVELSPEHKVVLESALESGLRSTPHLRASMSDIVNKFKSIQTERLDNIVQPSHN